MSRLLDRLDAAPPLLWVDADDYCARLLANDQVPWLDVAAWLAWQRKGQSLLKSEVASLSVAALVEAWLPAHAELRAAMAAKSRLLAPIRVLLADDKLRAHLRELLIGLRASQAGVPLVLQLPSPRCWVDQAYAQAFADAAPAEVTADDADSAAVYIADFLRAFADTGIDALLLTEDAASVPASDEDLACYGAVFNIAAHYRWACGLRLPANGAFDASSLDYLIAPLPPPGVRRYGAWLDAAAASSAAGDAECFSYLQLPIGSRPEQVLEQLARLRSA